MSRRAPVVTSPAIVVVNGQTETAEVLQALLEPRGINVHRVSLRTADASSPAVRPALVIYHSDDLPPIPLTRLWPNVLRLVIGDDIPAPTGAKIAQPFDFDRLLNVVEGLVLNRAA